MVAAFDYMASPVATLVSTFFFQGGIQSVAYLVLLTSRSDFY